MDGFGHTGRHTSTIQRHHCVKPVKTKYFMKVPRRASLVLSVKKIFSLFVLIFVMINRPKL